MSHVLTLYHGSPDIVRLPIFGKGNPHNDYGQGFYCTQSLAMAQEWGCVEGHDGFANQYEFDIEGLNVLNLSDSNYNILNWLAILLDNREVRLASGLPKQAGEYLMRHFLPEYRSFDVIRGYRADDSYFAFASAFLSGSISLDQLRCAMTLGELDEQIVAISADAFSRFMFVNAIPAQGAVFYQRKETRNLHAKRAYQEQRSAQPAADTLYAIDMLREGWTNDSPCLRHPVSR